MEVTTLQLVAASCMSSVQESWVWKLMSCEAHGESVGTIQSHGDRKGALVNTRSQPLWMGNGLSGSCGDAYLIQESIEHSHHAREETMCMVFESQTQASP